MNGIFFRLEAVQSRIASYSCSYSCPRGVSGRLHTIRLRRCFQGHSFRQASTAVAEQPAPANTPRFEVHHGLENVAEDTVGAGADNGERENTYEGSQPPALAPAIVKRVKSRLKLDGRSRLLARRGEKYSQSHTKVPGQDGDNPTLSWFPEHRAQFEQALFIALRRRDPHMVLTALKNIVSHNGEAQTNELLEHMSAATFSKLLLCLDPKHFVGRYQELHRNISEDMARRLRLPSADAHGYYKFCDIFLGHVNGLLSARARSVPLSLTEFRYLLRCARATGNGAMANEIWTNLKRRAISPDLECYNHYLAVLGWADTLNPILRYRLRVIARNNEPRSWNRPPRSLKGYRIGPSGIKSRVSEIFRGMIQAGVAGDEETFCHIMIAFAREGDLAGVASILKRVWDIDIDRLMQSHVSEPSTKHYTKDSPYFPSEQLLYSIAHAYGINNAIPTALRLVDYVSRQYSVTIPHNVWKELLMWTGVLSAKRNYANELEDETIDARKSDQLSNLVGQLPPEAVSNLWATMTSDPYNVQPTMEMYLPLIRNLMDRQRFGEALARMNEARKLYKAEVDNISQKLQALNSTFPQERNPIFDRRKRDLDFFHLESLVHRQFLRKWVEKLIYQSTQSLRRNPDWQFRKIPKLLEHWALFLPNRTTYEVDSGTVKFWTGNLAEKRLVQWVWRNSSQAPTQIRKRKRKGTFD